MSDSQRTSAPAFAVAAKSFGAVVERRLLAPLDFEAAERDLHRARVAGDPARVAGAEFQLELAADADAAARADSAAVFVMMMRDALTANPGAVVAAIFADYPGLALVERVVSAERKLDRLARQAGDGSAVVA